LGVRAQAKFWSFKPGGGIPYKLAKVSVSYLSVSVPLFDAKILGVQPVKTKPLHDELYNDLVQFFG
jgi:hypothetical protein